MKTTEMSDTNNIRNKTRTPNILNNVDRPLPSPTSTSMKLNDSAPLSPALSPNTKSMISQKVQTLKQRKQDLDKLLIEKNSLLQQLCREEAKIIGCSTYSLNDVANLSGIDCGDGGGVNNISCDRLQLNNNNNNNNSTLRRHIDTGFKLPENLLNSNEDDINQLLLSKKIQQQISQASMKLANDLNQTKSIRRAHRQNYEVAQQKLQSINQTLSIIRSRSNTDSITNRDDINHNNNLAYSPMNNVINGSKLHSSTTDNKLKQPNLNVSSISLENNNVMPERRNSAISTGSASQYLATNAAMKSSRPRCDSYNGQSTATTIHAYAASTSGNSDKVLHHSPTYSYQQQVQIPHLHYKSHADKIAYVTNAVSNAAPGNNLNTSNPNANAMASPKYGRLKPLTVDTGINESYYYPPSGSANHQHHRTHFQQQHYTQPHQHHQHRHSPYTTIRTSHLTPTKVKHSISSASSHQHAATKTLGSDDEDDIAGQYATLLTLSDQPKPISMHPENEALDSETHYTEILCRKPSAPLPLTERNHFQTKEANVVSKNHGLGGYWTTNENNERVWLSLDNRYASLDRKSQKNRMKKQATRSINQPTKSTSLSNFNFINKSDDILDTSPPINSAMNRDNEHRRSKEKQWTETSLDGPVVRRNESTSPMLVSPPIYYRDKTRLSSHSMHSPSRNAMTIGNSNTLTALQTPQILNNLSKVLSTSANALSGIENVSRTQPQPPASPSYYHTTTTTKTTTVPLFDNTNLNVPTTVSSSKIIQSSDVPSITTPPPPPLSSSSLSHPSSTTTTTTNSFLEMNNSSNCYSPNISSADIQVESPKNVTIVQPAKFQPYKEVTKPFEMSDFYKYSTKFRQKTASANIMQSENNSPQLPPKNAMHQMKSPHRQHMHSMSMSGNVVGEHTSSPAYSINQ